MADPVLIRALADLCAWSADVAKLSLEGGPVLGECFAKIRELLKCSGAGTEHAGNGVRYRIPRLLGTSLYKKWDGGGFASWTNSVNPLSTTTVIDIINSALTELNTSLGLKKMCVASLNGAESEYTVKKNMILAGASHMKRLSTVLSGHGYSVKLVETKNWRATTQLVSTLLVDVQAALAGLDRDNTVLVIGVLDNSYFKARFEDGDAIPICRRIDGSFHVDGDVICSPLETARTAFSQLVPLLKALPEVDKVFLAPLPRYLWRSCCADPQHAPNIHSEDHVVNMLAEIETANRAWRGICFREKVRNVKLCNAGSVLAVKHLWNTDPVHPTIEGYEKVAEYILNGVQSMEARRSAANLEMMEAEPAKRPLTDPEAGPSYKRGYWTSGEFVSRDTRWISQEQQGFGGQRGRGGGRGGWNPRGRGGWPGFRGRGNF
jgi:hypothetical protein